MIGRVEISKFRSIKEADLEIKPLTIFYGQNASGKSSLLYSLIVLKNFILNPNQQVDNLFDIGFINLDGFKNCVFNQEENEEIKIHLSLNNGEYGILLRKDSADILMNSEIVKMNAEISIPYMLDKNFTYVIKYDEKEYGINWNGITLSVSPKLLTAINMQKAAEITRNLNQIPEYLKKINISPYRRGFFKPGYSPVRTSLNPTSEDEVATIIINNTDLAHKISVDLKNIFNKDFRLHIPPITSIAFFQSTDTSDSPVYLVNEGSGVNQIVYILAKIHGPDTKTILIEEPEINLHPSTICNLVKVFCSIIKEEKKQVILTTHSEVFINSILAAIRKRDIESTDVKFYLVEKEDKVTKYKEQKINEDGQIEGGLSSLIENEIDNLKIFFQKFDSKENKQ